MTKKPKQSGIYIGCRLTPEVYQKLKTRAQADGRSISRTLQRWIEEKLKNKDNEFPHTLEGKVGP